MKLPEPPAADGSVYRDLVDGAIREYRRKDLLPVSISPFTAWLGGFAPNEFDKCDERESERRLALIRAGREKPSSTATDGEGGK